MYVYIHMYILCTIKLVRNTSAAYGPLYDADLTYKGPTAKRQVDFALADYSLDKAVSTRETRSAGRLVLPE